ncbi:MAG: SDR family NAD(P)-dependent oxidoreductase [Calothrix sp. MO_167.B12]|nr:SDR family NAD(P)-dependent oxidoreductase [Calothrix sp. MO_167.B12]
MKEFRDKVAVVTGAASGIGRAIATHCVSVGMKLVLADIEEEALLSAEAELKSAGGRVISVVTDVSQRNDIELLAQKTLEAFGVVHLLCNNAGVAAGLTAWETTFKEWKWTLGVNLWGVIHGIQTFVPIMLEQDIESYIVNTASLAGLLSYFPSVAYHASKHAVIAISEKLYYDLGENGGKISVSVLCPGMVRTRIMEAERNRPVELQEDTPDRAIAPEMEITLKELRQAVETGMSPDEVADQMFRSIMEKRFYILTHPEAIPLVQARMEAIIQGKNPLPLREFLTQLGLDA